MQIIYNERTALGYTIKTKVLENCLTIPLLKFWGKFEVTLKPLSIAIIYL